MVKLSSLWCSILLLMLLPGVFAFQEKIILTNSSLTVETSVDNITLPLSVPFTYVLSLGVNGSCANTFVYNSSVVVQNYTNVWNMTNVVNQSVISTVVNNNMYNTTVINNTWVQNITKDLSCPAAPACNCPSTTCTVDYEQIRKVVQTCVPDYLVSNLSRDVAEVKAQINLSAFLLNYTPAAPVVMADSDGVVSGGNVSTSLLIIIFASGALVVVLLLFWFLLIKPGLDKKKGVFEPERKSQERFTYQGRVGERIAPEQEEFRHESIVQNYQDKKREEGGGVQ